MLCAPGYELPYVPPKLAIMPVIATSPQTRAAYESYGPDVTSRADWEDRAMVEIRHEVNDKMVARARDQRYALYIYAPSHRHQAECEQILQTLVGSSQQRFRVLLEPFE